MHTSISGLRIKRWNIHHSYLFKMQTSKSGLRIKALEYSTFLFIQNAKKRDHNPYLRFVYKNAAAANGDHDSNSDFGLLLRQICNCSQPYSEDPPCTYCFEVCICVLIYLYIYTPKIINY